MIDVKKKVAQILADCTSIVAFNGIKFDMPFILKWLDESPSSHVLLTGIESKYLELFVPRDSSCHDQA